MSTIYLKNAKIMRNSEVIGLLADIFPWWLSYAQEHTIRLPCLIKELISGLDLQALLSPPNSTNQKNAMRYKKELAPYRNCKML